MWQYNYRTAVTFVQHSVKEKGWVDVMEHAGFKARLMKAERIKDDGEVHGLPQGESIPVFPIACLPGAPKDWVRAAGTYVCPVNPNWGLWFSWTDNDPVNTAIIPSAKGMNPITGMEMKGLGLESYINNCPKHGEPFAHGRFCEKCSYEWPAQNYVCSPGVLWWDGFRQSDGTIRQFFFSEDEARDIASLVIGKEKTVPAFGFAFYKTKVRRELPQIEHVYHTLITQQYYPYYPTKVYKEPQYYGHDFAWNQSKGLNDNVYDDGHQTMCSVSNSSSGNVTASNNYVETQDVKRISKEPKCQKGAHGPSHGILRSMNLKSMDAPSVPAAAFEEEIVKSVSVGAGAQIAQKLEDDTLGVSGWEEKPGGVVRLYFCFENQFKNIVKTGGIKELIAKKEGFMDKLPVG